jgi:ligand-binding sensor domain-containing protein/signal transduction histidine kinase
MTFSAASRIRAAALWFLLSLAEAVVCIPAHATTPDGAAATQRPAEPRIAAQVIHLPVVVAGGLRFRHISTTDGLSQTRVAQIVQDDLGFMWFGTQYGLNRYDGYEFKLYVHEPGNPNSLAGAFIFSLFKDRSGFLWIGCNQVLDRFDPRTEVFTHYRIDKGAHDSFGGTVVHISQDRSGLLWLATGTGLHSLDPQTGELRHFSHSAQDAGSLSTNDVKWSGEDHNGNLWVGTSEGLDEFDPTAGRVTLHVPLHDGVQTSFFETKSGHFWIIHASGNGLALYDSPSNTLTEYSFYAKDPAPDALTGVMSMLQDRDGNLWVGSPGLGLLRLDEQRQQFFHYPHRPQDLTSIAEDKVIALFEDREGNIWTGSHSVGPGHFARRGLPFRVFKYQPDDPNSLSLDFVNAIYEDSRKVLWIGNDDALNWIDPTSGHRSSTTAGLGTKPMVITITGDAAGLIWFGTYGHGLGSYDPKSGQYRTYHHDPSDPSSLSDDRVHRVFVDREKRLWVGTDDGLNLYDPPTQRFRTFALESESHLSQSYVAIDEDSSGALWLGTSHSGLHRFDPTTGHFTVYRNDPAKTDGLRDDTVPMVHVARSGLIWAGTQNGLNSLNPRTGRFQAFDVRNGLPANTISCILEDAQGNLWLSTNNGLSKLDPSHGTFANYAVFDGLPGNDLTGWSTCFKSADGELFFGGFAGAVAFKPEQLTDISYLPTVVLTDLEVSGAPARIGPTALLQNSIAYTDSVTLTYRQNNFSVGFAGLRYSSPETNRYRYRLEGLDSNWHESGSGLRRASFTTLPAGAYKLIVQAASWRGPWNDPGVTLRLRILAPWWATWWFRAVCAGLLILLTGLAYQLRLKQVSTRLRIHLEASSDERLRIARELHDTMLQGLISASMQISVANDRFIGDSATKDLYGRVAQLLRQMIDEGRNTLRGLRVRHVGSEELEHALSSVPRDLGIDLAKIQLKMVVEGRPRPFQPLVRNEIYWIGREALSNALRHSGAELIEVQLKYLPDGFSLSIKDNGRGMSDETLQTGQQNHWGIPGMNERASRIGARLNISSAPSAGTEVEIEIPADRAFLINKMRGQ